MLAIHYSPVKNTKHILRQGITKSASGTFCFPMTGNARVDKFWAQAFRSWRPRTQYNGFVFRVLEQDMPAAFSHWLHGAAQKPLQTLGEIEQAWRDSLIFRIGERFHGYGVDVPDPMKISEFFEGIGTEMIAHNPRLYTAALDSDPAFLAYALEDYQLVLSHSIAAKRILRVIPGSNQSGREIARRKKAANFEKALRADK